MNGRSDEAFWDEKYQEGYTGWDVGYPSTPIVEYADQLKNKDLKILIPGAGNAWEAEYFFKKGFNNLTVLDISGYAISNFKKRVPDFPQTQLIHGDFFTHTEKYDLIIEQTFFCALPKVSRGDYAKKMFETLNPSGKLVGVLFDMPLNNDRPPYGGSLTEYREYFRGLFEFKTFEKCRNSIEPRKESELFINLVRL